MGSFESVQVCDTGAAVALLGPSLLGRDREAFHVLHLGPSLGLIGHAIYAAGTTGFVDVPLRTLFHEALGRDSQALILAHNHPDGDLRPSEADKAVTRQIVEIARPLEIMVLDHLIFGQSDWTSFRRLGLI